MASMGNQLIPDHLIEEIKDRTSLVDLVSRKVQLRRAGKDRVGLCPFHNEKTPSFNVVEDRGFYHCFGCGAHGDSIKWLQETEGQSFIEAVKYLADKAGVPLPAPSPQHEAQNNRQHLLQEILQRANLFYVDQLKSAAGKAALSYLEKRGVGTDALQSFSIGLAPKSRDALTTKLRDSGVSLEDLEDCGLTVRDDDGSYRDRFIDRVMLPIFVRGRLTGFGGRALGRQKAKYLNSQAGILFDKGNSLYNFDRAKQTVKGDPPAILVEGYFDVISLDSAGIKTAVAPMGTALTAGQLKMLWSLSDEPVLVFDGDTAGQRAAARAAELAFPMLQPGKSLRFVSLPDSMDPDEFVRSQGPAAFRSLVNQAADLSDWLWEHLKATFRADTPSRLSSLRATALAMCDRIEDRSVRSSYRGFFFEQFRKQRSRAAAQRPTGLQPNIRIGGHSGSIHRERSLLSLLVAKPFLLIMELERLAALRFRDPECRRLADQLLALMTEGQTGEHELAQDMLEERIGDFDSVREKLHDTDQLDELTEPEAIMRASEHFDILLTAPILQQEISDLRKALQANPDPVTWNRLKVMTQELERITIPSELSPQ